MITHSNINPKPHTMYGKKYNPVETVNTYNADIIPGESIRIYGTYRNRVNGPVEFDKTFKIGDWAEYGSYNLKYNGQIVKIYKGSVTIQSYGKNHQLDLHTFCWRNWDFDLEASEDYNAHESYYI